MFSWLQQSRSGSAVVLYMTDNISGTFSLFCWTVFQVSRGDLSPDDITSDHLLPSHTLTAKERYAASQTEKRILLDQNVFYSKI